MIKINQAVIVEGKYDKIKLSAILDALIIETGGFGIFKDKEKQLFIKRLALEKGIVIMTDSDAAGFKIRAFLGGMLPQDSVVHVYVPDIYGREKRKEQCSKEGKLGVEGLDKSVIIAALEKAGINPGQGTESLSRSITSADLYEYGVAGRENSRERRIKLLTRLGLPSRLSTGALLKTLNSFIKYEDFLEAVNDFTDC